MTSAAAAWYDRQVVLCPRAAAALCLVLAACHPSVRGIPAAAECGAHGFVGCRTACEQGDADGCVAVAAACQGDVRPVCVQAGPEAMARGCELGAAAACLLHGCSLVTSDQDQLDQALEQMDRSCELGSASGCDAALALHIRVMDPRYAGNWRALRRRAEQACVAGSSEACTAFADTLALGLGGPAEPERARRLDQVECQRGNEAGCHNYYGGFDRYTSLDDLLLDPEHTPGPDALLEDARRKHYGELGASIALRICIAQGSTTPSSVEVIESSGHPELDRTMTKGIGQWRVRRLDAVPGEFAVCPLVRFAFEPIDDDVLYVETDASQTFVFPMP